MHPTQNQVTDPVVVLDADAFDRWAEETEAYERDLIERYLTKASDQAEDQADDTAETYGTPADTLRCAAIYLDHHGWTQGHRFANTTDTFPAADITGAIRTAVYGYPNTDEVLNDRLGWHVDMALAAFADHLGLTDPDMHLLGWLAYSAHAVTCWNDDPWQTFDQVITALHAAADAYDATNGGTR